MMFANSDTSLSTCGFCKSLKEFEILKRTTYRVECNVISDFKRIIIILYKLVFMEIANSYIYPFKDLVN